VRAISAEPPRFRPDPVRSSVASRRVVVSRVGRTDRVRGTVFGSSLVVGFGFGFDLLVIHGIMFIYSTFTLCVL